MYTRKAAKKVFHISFFFNHEEISGVVGRKSEQCLGTGRVHLKCYWTTSLVSWNLNGPSLSGFCSRNSCLRFQNVPEFRQQVPEFRFRSFSHIWKKILRHFLSNHLNTKALRVLIVQSPRTINLFQLIKLLKPWNLFCFAFLALIGGAARQNITFSHRTQNGCPKETGKFLNKNKNKTKKTAHK